jgi:glycerophosphoryl diester phosphodiesterase
VAFAHRGAYGDAVDENTTEALEAAYAKGAHMETDLWLTQDQGFLIMHDDTLDRTTDCEGNVSDWRLADIQANCRTEPNGQLIPDFNGFVDVLSNNPGQLMMVEVKGDGWFDDDNKPLKRLRRAASQAGVLKRVYFANYDGTGTLEALRDVAPRARTALKQVGEENITPKDARELSVDAVALRPRQWTSRDKVRSFRSKGFLAWSLLVNDEPAWKALIRRGVTGVLTDEPSAFRKVCNQTGS